MKAPMQPMNSLGKPALRKAFGKLRTFTESNAWFQSKVTRQMARPVCSRYFNAAADCKGRIFCLVLPEAKLSVPKKLV